MGFLILLALASALSIQTQAPASAAAPQGNAETGKKFFETRGCWQCHGTVAQGGSAGPRLAPRPIAWPTLSKYVRHPTGDMIPYTTKILADQELADIYSFLLTIPPPPHVSSIPALRN